MIQPVKHDWPKMIADLEASGMSLYKIGVAIGLQLNQMWAIREGREPKHFHGERLRLLHVERISVMSTHVTMTPHT